MTKSHAEKGRDQIRILKGFLEASMWKVNIQSLDEQLNKSEE